MKQVTIHNITYNVIESDTPEHMAARGLDRVAQEMREEGCTAFLGLQRPKGRAVYFTKEYVRDNYTHYSLPFSLGR